MLTMSPGTASPTSHPTCIRASARRSGLAGVNIINGVAPKFVLKFSKNGIDRSRRDAQQTYKGKLTGGNCVLPFLHLTRPNTASTGVVASNTTAVLPGFRLKAILWYCLLDNRLSNECSICSWKTDFNYGIITDIWGN